MEYMLMSTSRRPTSRSAATAPMAKPTGAAGWPTSGRCTARVSSRAAPGCSPRQPRRRCVSPAASARSRTGPSPMPRSSSAASSSSTCRPRHRARVGGAGAVCFDRWRRGAAGAATAAPGLTRWRHRRAAAARSRARVYGRLVAFLAARSHDIAAAEDALGEAFAAALVHWPADGVPESPEARLLTRLAAASTTHWRHAATTPVPRSRCASCSTIPPRLERGRVPRRAPALMFACAHPAIDGAARPRADAADRAGPRRGRIASAFLGRARRAGSAPGARQDADPRAGLPSPCPIAPRCPLASKACSM